MDTYLEVKVASNISAIKEAVESKFKNGDVRGLKNLDVKDAKCIYKRLIHKHLSSSLKDKLLVKLEDISLANGHIKVKLNASTDSYDPDIEVLVQKLLTDMVIVQSV